MVADADGGRADRPQRADKPSDRDTGGVLEVPADREGGEHDGEVGLDGVAFAVEDRTGA